MERKATVTYRVVDRVETITCWIMLSRSGDGISARKIGGRRRWLLARLENVLEVKYHD